MRLSASAHFLFGQESPVLPTVVVSDAIATKHHLLRTFAEQLHFPSYFGENWDALVDMLSTPAIGGASLSVVHPGLPRIGATDLTTYVLCLASVARRRAVIGGLSSRFFFAETDRAEVERALAKEVPTTWGDE